MHSIHRHFLSSSYRHCRSRFLHSTPTLFSQPQPKLSPDLYLKDDGQNGNVVGGITEDEGADDQGAASAHKYVVAGQLPSEAHYGVPSGAYHSSDPLEPLQETKPPQHHEPSSTSPEHAHPVLSKKAARVEDGVGSSGAVRHRNSPGAMKDGGYGGAKLSDGVTATENKLDDRNPGPTAEMGRQGIHEAWKHRK